MLHLNRISVLTWYSLIIHYSNVTESQFCTPHCVDPGIQKRDSPWGLEERSGNIERCYCEEEGKLSALEEPQEPKLQPLNAKDSRLARAKGPDVQFWWL